MKVTRKYTKEGHDVFGLFDWTKRSSRITNPDGSTVFEMNDAEVPKNWTQLATDIMVSKYFRKAGVPQFDENGTQINDENGETVTGPERSARQVIHRLAGCWRHWGETNGYFDSTEDAQAFYDELSYTMLDQMTAPNSPQWFNTGLHWAYQMDGPPQGHWYTDPESGETTQAEDAYSRPQPHACFIQSVEDSLVREGGIMDLWVREARLFKYGSGTGTNFSSIRGENEPLSGGGRSSGLMSFLRIGDRAAGAIKSGGTTRRAAKMVCLDLDHPDIEEFISWKVREEIKVAALAEGLKHLSSEHRKKAEELDLHLDYDFNGEGYTTVSGQNSNNSVRIPNTFFEALDADADWELSWRTDGKGCKTIPARKLWDKIAYAAWRCADPGVQYDSTINQWHTCPESGRINASNPCSEYMFLDNTACNLASINLLKFYDAESRTFDVERFEHVIRLWTIVLEISVLMAAFPSREIAKLSYDFRTLGLGFANLGAMLMQAGIPYDSDHGRAICGSISAIMTGRSYAVSAEMAREHGPFAGYESNRKHMLRVIRNHRRAAYGVQQDEELAALHTEGDYEELDIRPVGIDSSLFENNDGLHGGGISNSLDFLLRARACWDDALTEGEQHGYRNAQVSVIAPTGTIGLLMSCDTTGVEPDFALVKFKKLAGGGYFKIANESLKPSLHTLGYSDEQIQDMMRFVMGTLHLDVPMPDAKGQIPDKSQPGWSTFAEFLRGKGLIDEDLKQLSDALAGAMELGFVFNEFTLGDEAVERMGMKDQINLLEGLSLNRRQINKLNEMICGTGTIEGAPHIQEDHLAVFDCANRCGRDGKRFIAPEGHIRMMAAAQPFISGAISKTINLPHEATVEDIEHAYRLSWELGLKANALYRDGSKLSQPLNSKTDEDLEDEIEDEADIDAAKTEVAGDVAKVADAVSEGGSSQPIEKIVERIVERPLRRRLPITRQSLTHKFNVAGHEGYLTVGLYEDGVPGELFITMAKEGSTIGGLMDSLGTAVSVALQYGVPVKDLVNKFTHQRFEPAGITMNSDIPFAKSLVDYIFRWMGMEFVEGYREENAPKRPDAAGSTPARTTSSTKSATEKKPRISAKVEASAPATAAKGAVVKSGSDDSAELQEDAVVAVATQPMNALNEANSGMMGDAPACDVCGSITVRNGTCYRCLNCGNSMGCS